MKEIGAAGFAGSLGWDVVAFLAPKAGLEPTPKPGFFAKFGLLEREGLEGWVGSTGFAYSGSCFVSCFSSFTGSGDFESAGFGASSLVAKTSFFSTFGSSFTGCFSLGAPKFGP